MTDLVFNDGRKRFNINGVVEVAFNETDANFVERLYGVFSRLDANQDSYTRRVETMADKREIFSFMREMDEKMRAEINGLFDKDVCGPLFGSMNVFSLADGLPVWANLMLAIIDQVDTAFSREQKATNPRVEKYVAKWQKK